MPAADPLYTVCDGHLCFDGVDLVDLAADARDAVLRVQRAAPARQRRGRRRVVPALPSAPPRSSTPARPAPTCGSCAWCGPPAPASRSTPAASSGRRCAPGSRREQIVFNGVAKTQARDRARGRLRRARLHRRLAAASWAGSARSRRDLGTAGARGCRASTSTSPTRTHPGLETAHGGKAGIDRDDAAEAFRLAAAHPAPRAGRPAPAHRLADHQRRAVPAGARARRSTSGRGRGELPACALRFLDAGGGFAVPYREAPATCHPTATTSARCSTRRRLRRRGLRRGRARGGRTSTLFLEPGRSIAADTAVLVTRVESEKTKGLRDAAGRRIGDERWLTVDAGFNTLLEHTNYALVLPHGRGVRAPARRRTRSFRLAGPLCDGGDVFAGDADTPYRRFPAATTRRRRASPSCDAGAYTLEMMNPYNARPTAAAFAVTAAGRAGADQAQGHRRGPRGPRPRARRGLSVTRPTAARTLA